MAKVLLVDDDVELGTMLKEYLEHEGFAVGLVHEGEAGVRDALGGSYDIAVLDVMMPGISGMEVLRRIRAESPLPVLMLTARGDDLDRVVGLELGADDYVPKPCTPRELVARIRAILRRTCADASDDAPVVAGPLVMRPGCRLAEWRGLALSLTSTEYSLLETLARNAGRVVAKSELSEQALGRPLARFGRSIDVHVSSLRQKLGQSADGRSWIQTVRGIGYQFIRE